ncbi:hypothetical protein DRQ33_01190 [bacterium]|nr:MAG: hypothetical protein DRQ33_01190 [bacterium]
MKKYLWVIIILVVLVIFALAIFARFTGSKEKLVEVGNVEPRTIKSTVIAFGRIEPKSDVNISAEVTEKIETLYVEEGDTVKLGDTLVKLNRERYLAAVNKAKAQVSQVEANLSKAKENFKRISELYKSGAVSKDAFISAKTEVDIFEAQLESARAALKEANNNLSQTIITAPMDGIVTSVQAEKGEFVVVGTMNNPGSVIMQIAQLTDMQAKVEVDEADIVDLELGQYAKIELDALPDTFFDGRVVQIAHKANVQSVGGEETRAVFYVDIAILDPSKELRPGMSVTATITTAIHDSVLAIPLSSIVAYRDTITDKESEAVFIIENGIAQKKPVKTGISDDRFIEITDGLTESDQIVIGPFKILRELKEGDKVKVIKKPEFKPGRKFPPNSRKRN